MQETVIRMIEENVQGVLLRYGAHVSLVKYTVGGVEFEEVVENDEFEILREPFEYEYGE